MVWVELESSGDDVFVVSVVRFCDILHTPIDDLPGAMMRGRV